MKTIESIYFKVQTLNQEIKKELFNKGIVVPVQQKDGSIKVGNYFIKKIDSNHYTIYNIKKHSIIDGINLPQTAIVLANRLALGKWLDSDLIEQDKKYGYAAFDEQVHKASMLKNLKQKNYDRYSIMNVKTHAAKHKKDYYKKSIVSIFNKLSVFR